MNKLLILILSILIAVSFIACDGSQGTAGDSKVDIDFTIIDDPYNTILGFHQNPEDFQGKSIAIKAGSSVIYNFSKNTVDKKIMLGLDPTGCCNAYYEIRTNDGIYPDISPETTFIGNFTENGYIELTSFSSPSAPTPKYEIDTLDMSAEELKSFILEYSSNYQESPSFEKTVRVFGHLLNQGDYKYLFGLNEKGVQTWGIELYEPTGELIFPTVSGNFVNPVEIIGKLSIYFENGIAYSCITVERVSRVECVFS